MARIPARGVAIGTCSASTSERSADGELRAKVTEVARFAAIKELRNATRDGERIKVIAKRQRLGAQQLWGFTLKQQRHLAAP